MMFLMRTAFWVSVALALLPSFVSGQSKTVPTDVGTSEAATAASATFADLSHFCDRRPEACAAGAQLASAFGQRAQAGAKIVYEFVGDRLANDAELTAAVVLPPRGCPAMLLWLTRSSTTPPIR